MSKRLIITVDDDVYAGLYHVIGRRRISRFMNDLARPHVVGPNLAPNLEPNPGPDQQPTLAQDPQAANPDGEREQPPMEWVERGVCP